MDLFKVAEIELTYKTYGKTTDRPKISKAEDAYHILHQYWDENTLDLMEQSKMLLLNRNGRVLGISHLSTGGVTGTIMDARLIFVTALKANASSIIIAHNHPSANLMPSYADQEITRRLKDAGKLLQIDVLDHLIVTSEGYYSFADEQGYEKVERPGGTFFEILPPF